MRRSSIIYCIYSSASQAHELCSKIMYKNKSTNWKYMHILDVKRTKRWPRHPLALAVAQKGGAMRSIKSSVPVIVSPVRSYPYRRHLHYLKRTLANNYSQHSFRVYYLFIHIQINVAAELFTEFHFSHYRNKLKWMRGKNVTMYVRKQVFSLALFLIGCWCVLSFFSNNKSDDRAFKVFTNK